MNRVAFTNQVKLYGFPISCSSNGLNFLFKKSVDVIKGKYYGLSQVIRKHVNKDNFFIKEYFIISIVNISIFGMIHLKDIDIMGQIKSILKPEIIDANPWLFQTRPSFTQLLKDIDYQVMINNNQEVIVRIQKIDDNCCNHNSSEEVESSCSTSQLDDSDDNEIKRN